METVADASATNGTAVKYDWNGTAQMMVTTPTDATAVTLRVRGDQCAGAPAYTVTIDGAQVASDTVTSTTWTDKTYRVPTVGGLHSVSITFTNNYSQSWPACNRILYLDSVSFTSDGPLPTNPAVPAGFVHQHGTGLLDGAGHPLRLHGVDLGGWLIWEGWIWGQGFDYIGESAMMGNLSNLVGSSQAESFRSAVRANYITSSDFHAMASDGFNVVRVPFNYRLLEDDSNPFVYKQSGWDVLDQVISQAKQAGVYVILDMHAAPCSQMQAFVSDYVPGPNFLWSTPSCQDRMVAMWKAIAARYANENTIAGYDLLGETIIGDDPLRALYQRVTSAIRSVDSNHLIIYEGNDMARTFSLFTAPLDSNEMLSIHDYAWAFPGQDVSVRMATWDAAAQRLGAPLYVGEFGESSYADDTEYVTKFNNDPLVAAWTEWTWKQAPGYAAMQNIQESPAAQKLIDWMDNPSRPQPTSTEARQGMSDFLSEIRFENTLPDAQLRGILAAPGPAPTLSTATATAASPSISSAAAPVSAAPAAAPSASPVPIPAPASLAPGPAPHPKAGATGAGKPARCMRGPVKSVPPHRARRRHRRATPRRLRGNRPRSRRSSPPRCANG